MYSFSNFRVTTQQPSKQTNKQKKQKKEEQEVRPDTPPPRVCRVYILFLHLVLKYSLSDFMSHNGHSLISESLRSLLISFSEEPTESEPTEAEADEGGRAAENGMHSSSTYSPMTPPLNLLAFNFFFCFWFSFLPGAAGNDWGGGGAEIDEARLEQLQEAITQACFVTLPSAIVGYLPYATLCYTIG